ncbi:hypothetical protein Cgig2_004008 [Carnegiea gigantea]|uniref:CCT domain-containing protein n=1 Tax=Carnegiea gigantea TaxID=171969 RepID=A0A9Q1KB07_9CARY|nr:hypothetical protein Cgig2_004008 [Carnegiea gigantea]
MGGSSALTRRSPKKEDQQLSSVSADTYQGLEILDDFEENDSSFLNEDQQHPDAPQITSYKAQQQMPTNSTCDARCFLHWDFTSYLNNSNLKQEEMGDYLGFWNTTDQEDAVEETKASLNLNLNYERVLQAWSNRPSLSFSDNNYYLGEERTRRESSVLRYKEKRQSRLFSKKIRYEVRKLNADKRPRLKGRFVKTTPENKMSKE